MNKVTLHTILLLIWPIVSFGQINKVLDSLENSESFTETAMLAYCDSLLAGKSLKPTESVYVYVHMSDACYYLEDINKSLYYSRLAIDNMTDDYPISEKATLYNNHGQNFNFLGVMDSALIFYKKSLEMAKNVNDSTTTAELYNNIGVINYQSVNLVEALQYFDSAADLSYELKDKVGLSYSLRAIASIQIIYNDYEVALRNLQDALRYSEGADSAHRCTIYYSLGKLSVKRINQADADKFEQLCKSCFDKVSDQTALNYYYTLKAENAFLKGDTATAVSAIDSAILLSGMIGDKIEEMKNYMLKIKFRGEISDISKLKAYKALAKEKNLVGVLLAGYDALQLKALKEKNFEAAYFYRDSLENEKRAFELDKNRLMLYAQSSKYNLLKKESEISLTKQRLYTQRLYAFIIFGVLIFAALTIIIFLIYRQKRSKLDLLRKQLEKEAELQKKVLENESKALRAQMNPHFMFNALNSIKGLIIKQQDKEAAKYISRFSKLIRSVLDNSKSKEISLEKELETLKNYIELEMLRFRDGFSYQINLSSNVNAEEILVPPMMIQPFVENAIWHGFKNNKRANNFYISVRVLDNELMVQIVDNGVGRSKSATQSMSGHRSYGTEITKERIGHFSNDNHQRLVYKDLYDEHNEATGTAVSIKIPIKI